MKVLVVDDEAESCAELGDALSRAGWQVVLAEGLDQALEMLRHDRAIGLVVTDLWLSEGTGFDLAAASREAAGKVLPFIMVTGRASTQSAIAALRNEFVDFIEKPVSIDLLQAAVARGARRHPAQRMVVPEAVEALQEIDRARAALARMIRGAQASEELESVSDTLGERAGHAFTSTEVAASIARMMRLRAHVKEQIGIDRSSDPCLDILLNMAEAELAGQNMTVTAACFAAGVPATTGLRRIDELERSGLIMRQADASDRRVSLLRLTDQGRRQIERAVRPLFVATAPAGTHPKRT